MRAAREAHVRKIFIVMQRVQQIHARAVLLVFFIWNTNYNYRNEIIHERYVFTFAQGWIKSAKCQQEKPEKRQMMHH